MKNELLNNIIHNKEEEISVKQKELRIIKYSLMSAKTSEYLKKYTKEEIKAMNAFTDEYLECKQRDINTLKELCNRYKKEYNLEEYKMKLSEFKEIILRKFGEKGWEEFKNSSEYLTYNATEKKVLEKIKNDNENIRFINNPTEEMQLEVMKRSNPFYYIQLINIPTKKVLQEAINRADTIHDYKYILKHIENDLNEK
nr:MAG TPA: hypothetical protein [Caudoviricetes sp.]